jgi:hypothetical protein
VPTRETISGVFDFSSLLGGGEVTKVEREKREQQAKNSSFFGGLFGIKRAEGEKKAGSEAGLGGLGRRHVPELGTYTTGEVQVVCEKVSPVAISCLIASMASLHVLTTTSHCPEPANVDPRAQADPGVCPLCVDAERVQVQRAGRGPERRQGLARYREGSLRERAFTRGCAGGRQVGDGSIMTLPYHRSQEKDQGHVMYATDSLQQARAQQRTHLRSNLRLSVRQRAWTRTIFVRRRSGAAV